MSTTYAYRIIKYNVNCLFVFILSIIKTFNWQKFRFFEILSKFTTQFYLLFFSDIFKSPCIDKVFQQKISVNYALGFQNKIYFVNKAAKKDKIASELNEIKIKSKAGNAKHWRSRKNKIADNFPNNASPPIRELFLWRFLKRHRNFSGREVLPMHLKIKSNSFS